MGNKIVVNPESSQAIRHSFLRRPILLIIILPLVGFATVFFAIDTTSPQAAKNESNLETSGSAYLAANPELSAFRRYTQNRTRITCTESALRAPNPDGLDQAAGVGGDRPSLRAITVEDGQRCQLGNVQDE